jgi:hypothetical protein
MPAVPAYAENNSASKTNSDEDAATEDACH